MDAAGVPLAEAMPAVWDRHLSSCAGLVSGTFLHVLKTSPARDPPLSPVRGSQGNMGAQCQLFRADAV
eukprot:344913-Pelagomonas_calceolata.AAC.7